ncbi:MAG: hypothetical protein AB1742_10450 [bacterium]
MSHLSKDVGFNGMSCASSCDKCAYFRYHLGKPFEVLVITDNDDLKSQLGGNNEGGRFRLQFASCEYECSFLIDRFRPDYVVVDCAMQEEKCRELCHHLANDPRIAGNTIILATPTRRLSISFPGTVRIRHPFNLRDLEEFLKDRDGCRSFRYGVQSGN